MKLEGMSILLAEDNPTNQMVALQMLESLGAEVVLAGDGAEALEILVDQSFDVALIDIEMPRISGIDLIRRLRSAGQRYADMPMIALTAYVMREHRAAIDSAGADGIIAKPILSIEQFGDDILSIVAQRDGRHGAVAEPDRSAGTSDANGFPLDRAVFEELCASFDDERLEELLEKVSADISDCRDRFSAAMDKFDMLELRAATHVLISVAGAIGATRLQELAQCLNSAGHAADKFSIDRDGPKLISEAGKVLVVLRGG